MRGAQLIPDLCFEIPTFPDFTRAFPKFHEISGFFLLYPHFTREIPKIPDLSRLFPIYP